MRYPSRRKQMTIVALIRFRFLLFARYAWRMNKFVEVQRDIYDVTEFDK